MLISLGANFICNGCSRVPLRSLSAPAIPPAQTTPSAPFHTPAQFLPPVTVLPANPSSVPLPHLPLAAIFFPLFCFFLFQKFFLRHLVFFKRLWNARFCFHKILHSYLLYFFRFIQRNIQKLMKHPV